MKKRMELVDAALAGKMTDEEYASLEDLIVSAGVDRVKFTQYLKVDQLSDLPAIRFDQAVRDLEARMTR